MHALKSTSKTIGAAELSDRALRLEAAGNAGDADVIRAEHADMLAQYRNTVAAIRAAEPKAEAPEKQEGEALEFAPENDDILEFSPD